MTVKLTKKTVDSLSLPDKGQAFVWDESLSGYGIRLTPSRKTYIVQARVGGKTRRVTLGVHGVITADQARKKAIKTLGQMNDGIDPGAARRKEKAEQATLREVADKYMEHKRSKRTKLLLKQSTKNDIDRHVKTTFADWEHKPLASITREMVKSKYREVSKSSEAQAVQGFRILQAIYSWQRDETTDNGGNPTMPENPCIGIKKDWAHIPARDRMIPLHKVGRVWCHLEALQDDPGQTQVGQTMAAAVMVAFLTGGRWGEIAPLTWGQIDFETATWTLPDTKNRSKIIFPLSSQALEILQGQTGKHEVYVFPGRGKDGHIHRPTRLMKKIESDCGVKISPHDLRRTFNAIAENCGIEFWKQKVLLGHTVHADVTLNNYKQTSDLTRLAPEVQQIADWIELKARQAAAGNVIDLVKSA